MRKIIWTDPRLNRFDIEHLMVEDRAQIDKWGVQEHDPFEWLTYAAEELGELARAISEHVYRGVGAGPVQHEAVQLATLALKIAKMVWRGRNEERP